MEEIENFLKKLGVGQRPMDDPFFDNTYKACKVFQRLGVTADDEEELCHTVMKEFRCNCCNAIFENLLDYELHYHDTHHFVCAQCKKWKPTSRLLEIHIQEAHDSFFKVLAEKKPMFQCFVSSCDEKFKTPQDRTEHCRTIHKFPKYYRFDEYARVKTDNKNDSSTNSKNDSMDVEESESNKKKNIEIHFGKKLSQKTFMKQNSNSKKSNQIKVSDTQTESNLSSKPATMFIPRQVQQKTYAKLLTKNEKKERNVLETESIMDLEMSLPNS